MEHEKQVSNDEEPALKKGSVFKRLDQAVQKLDKISAEVSNLQNLLERRKEKQQQQLEIRRRGETGSIPNNNVIGRSKGMEFVKQWLRNPCETEITNTNLYKNISLLSVLGHAGIGKTHLLRHVYTYEMTKEFGLKIWVSVSYNFHAKTVIKHILQSLKKRKRNLESLDALQTTLQSQVMSKKFLLVMDDIWEEDETEWENALAPLLYGSSGSKILITTRMESIAGLEERELLKIFKKHAFVGVENLIDTFKLIAEKMVEKLLECPLAAVVIRKTLNLNMDECYWKNVLNTDIGSKKTIESFFFSNLNLSYIYLLNYLKKCFSFCCIFSRQHEFDKDDLVRMWIALDFVQSSDIQGETIEDTGRRYFNILVQKSLMNFELMVIDCTTKCMVHYMK